MPNETPDTTLNALHPENTGGSFDIPLGDYSSEQGTSHRMTIKASYEAMRALREDFKRYLVGQGMGAEALHNWLVVFSEATNNAINHGARGDNTQTITVRWVAFGNTVELIISDPGLGFYNADTNTLLRSHGYGLKLIQNFCDTVEHLVNPAGGHSLRMCKKTNLPQVTSGQEEDVNHTFLSVLSNFYGYLGAPVSAGAMIEPILEYLQARFGRELTLELRTTADYTQASSYLSFYQGAPPCERCSECKPLLQLTPHQVREGKVSCFPLRLGKRALGSLAVLGLPQDPRSQELMECAATCIALAIENERQQETQRATQEALIALKVAANLQTHQRKLKAITQKMSGVIHTFEERAQSVAGDIIECTLASDGAPLMLIADVMGKGVAAAFLGGIFRGGWHLLSQKETHPLLLMKQLNRFMFDELNGQSMFVTATLAHLSPDGQMLSLVNAGHTPVYVQNLNGELKMIEPSGPPLGLFPEPSYELICLPTADIARLYMPTDGLYCWGADSAHFDHAKLEAIFKAHAKMPAEELWKTFQRMRENAQESIADDQALLIWEREGK